MHKTPNNTEHYIYHIFSHTHISVIKLSLQIRHGKRLTIITNHEIEQVWQYAKKNSYVNTFSLSNIYSAVCTMSICWTKR